MAREYGRSQRVASEMQKELAAILQRDVKDTRLGFVTINDVELSKDLAVAKVYITVLNGDDAAKLANVKVLNEISPFIRHELAKRMRLRHISELHFYYDHSFDTGMRVAELLHDLEGRQDQSDASDNGKSEDE
ncbi:MULTISPECIES: 30S ribosome-binding factor RbfA [Methylomonas]|uniref:Ribosome-binding factor A n=1 Tax=Methylomonas koyamae TaxID=702114 RepID=A0A177N1K5_9GAMM|nr:MULTISPECIES: 30S ribosome-binding factor RbfA [Methylomonas]NJA06841.1 30S ribosome-binding factor RbfA [Methylococcaceae bacterium WWC4]OAI11423.1 ribosome-binding factor A [Methylomonas koyamae]OHX35097.1 ribosome-binding factor A [Methylomonas sp. LWB]